MNPDCHRLDHGDSAVVCHRETDFVYSRGGVGVKNTDPCLGASFTELPHLSDDYSVRVRASGSVEEHCLSSEDCCRRPGERWLGRVWEVDIDYLVGPDERSRAVLYCHRDIIRASACEGVDGRVVSPVCPVSESPCESVGCCSTTRRGIQGNRVSRCWAGRAECDGCRGTLGDSSKDGACYRPGLHFVSSGENGGATRRRENLVLLYERD